jgi:hypothetical protein
MKRKDKATIQRLSAAGILLLLAVGCNSSNNMMLGEVRAMLGSHRVRVTDCYRTVPPVTPMGGEPRIYRFKPCRDADIAIRGEELLVNGRSYGQLQPNDRVLVKARFPPARLLHAGGR